MEPSACQWSGVANETTWISLSSKILRISHSYLGATPYLSLTSFARSLKNCSSASHKAVTLMFLLSFRAQKLLIWASPRLRRPITQTFMPVSYTHLRAHETDSYLVCRL